MGTVEISKGESVEYYEGQRHRLVELRGLESYWWCKEEDKPVGEKNKGLGHRTTRVIHHGGPRKRKL